MCVECTTSTDVTEAHVDLHCECVCSQDMLAWIANERRHRCKGCDHNLP